MVAATPASENELVTDDFDQFGSTVLGEILIADLVLNAYNEITITPSAINKTGTTILGLRLDKDVSSDSTFVADTSSVVQIASMDDADSGHHPFLTTVH